MKKYYLFLSILFLCNILNAQEMDKFYKDGAVYFKIKDNSNFFFSDKNELKEKLEFKELNAVFEDFGLNEISRPFIFLKTPIFDRTYEASFSDYLRVDDLIKKIANLEYIEYAEKVPLHWKSYTPNDPSLSTQNSYLTGVHAYEAWDLHKGGNSVIAIVDDAVKITHEDLAANVWENPDEIPNNGIDDDGNGFVDDYNGFDVANSDSDPNPPSSATNFGFSHGTHCAGIAGGTTDNGVGIASLGFFTKILAVKTNLDSSTSGTIDNGYGGLAYAITTTADVISMSWGGGGSGTGQNIINEGHDRGIVMVAAAGNGNTDALHYPAAFNHVIAVANVGADGSRTPSSNYGSWIDIAAPGLNIYSTVATSNSAYETYTGTSMSCPMVSALCALMKSYNPLLTPDQIESCLKSSSTNINSNNPNFVDLLGEGMINAEQALVCSNPNAAPIVNISTSVEGNSCISSLIKFKDESVYQPTIWAWEFPGGIPATSNLENPVVYYPSEGSYSVTLSATNANGTTVETFNDIVTVSVDGNEVLVSQDFTDGLSGWGLENSDADLTWEIVTLSEQDGDNNVISISNRNYNGIGQRDAFISPEFNLYARDEAILSFRHAHRIYNNASANDSLIIYLSRDGGVTYSDILFAAQDDGTGNFATNIPQGAEFYPFSAADWCGVGSYGSDCIDIDLSPFLGESNLKIKFENYNNKGNNIYIDDISVTVGCASEANPISGFEEEKSSVCTGETIQFIDQSLGLPSAWSWTFEGGTPSTSSDRNPIVTYSTPGTYDAILEVSNSQGTNTITKTEYIVVSSQGPTADFDLVQSWGTVTFDNQSIDGAEYLWDFGDGNTSTEASPTHSYGTIDQNYTITLTVTNGCGTDVFTQAVETTSIENPFGENTSFDVYPNPSQGKLVLEIKGKNNSSAQIAVYDILGRVVYQSEETLTTEDWTKEINLEKQSSGTYIVKIDIEGQSSYKKIILE